MKDVAVCVLTLNEELNISACLKSVGLQYDEVHVVDSGSADATREIASIFTNHIYVRKQSGVYSAADQRNWALKNIESDKKWILFVDADELLDDDFSSCLSGVDELSGIDVVCVPLVYRLHGRIVKSQGYPNCHDRVVRRDVVFNSAVGEHVNSDKKIYLEGAKILHNFNSLGVARFWEKQARYASYIGGELYLYRKNGVSRYYDKQDGNGGLKRFAAKIFWLRPLARFGYNYFYKKGFMEGRAGLVLALNNAFFEYLVIVASIEAARVDKGLEL